jgi:hypothetical protein
MACSGWSSTFTSTRECRVNFFKTKASNVLTVGIPKPSEFRYSNCDTARIFISVVNGCGSICDSKRQIHCVAPRPPPRTSAGLGDRDECEVILDRDSNMTSEITMARAKVSKLSSDSADDDHKFKLVSLQLRQHNLLPGSHIPKQISSNLPYLDLLTALRNPIPPVMPPDMLELAVAAISPPTMDLNCAVSSLGAQPVRPVITHADLVTELCLDFNVVHTVHFGGSLAD